jgi:hypothetical protein
MHEGTYGDAANPLSTQHDGSGNSSGSSNSSGSGNGSGSGSSSGSNENATTVLVRPQDLLPMIDSNDPNACPAPGRLFHF